MATDSVDDPDSTQSGDVKTSTFAAIDDLATRAKLLLSEVMTFKERVQFLKPFSENIIEIGAFKGMVEAEIRGCERLSDKSESEAIKGVISCNLPFAEHVWSTVKRSKNVLTLRKRIYTTSRARVLGQKMAGSAMRHIDLGNLEGAAKGGSKFKESGVVVDIIADSGRTWTKVVLITNKRLLFDLAKEGWDSGGSEDEDEDDNNARATSSDEDRDVPLVKTAKDLSHAASVYRVRGKTPRVHLVLPRIQRDQSAEVDAVLADCEAAGAVVSCADEMEPTPDIQDVLHAMIPDPTASFTETLNLDCTILLALVSEFSHAKVSKEPWFSRALNRQVEVEDNENLLPSLLYPAIGGHKLVATKEAVQRMREIVDTIGTSSEKARTAILLGDEGDGGHDKQDGALNKAQMTIAFDSVPRGHKPDSLDAEQSRIHGADFAAERFESATHRSKSQAELVKEMQEWSAHPVPENWQLPIRVVDQNEDGCQSSLPSAAQQVAERMTPINRSVFLHGWAAGRTTITSNRTVAKAIEADLDKFHDATELEKQIGPSKDDDIKEVHLEDNTVDVDASEASAKVLETKRNLRSSADLTDPSIPDGIAWPHMWVCPTSRSLVGKEKRGAKKQDADGTKEEGRAQRLPDPLTREQHRRHGLDMLSRRAGYEVEDLRPNGYPCEEVLAAKNASLR